MNRFYLLGVIFFCLPVFGQLDTINNSYFNNQKEVLLRDNNVEKVDFVQKKIVHDSIYSQQLYVKYKNDLESRYFRVGKSFNYFTSNNNLAFVSNADIDSQTLSDTTFYFTENGDTAFLEIYNLPYDSVIIIKDANSLWSGFFGNKYIKIPNIYKTIEYTSCTKDTVIEKNYKYSPLKGFLLNGDVIYRNKKMEIIKSSHFSMGIEIPDISEEKKGTFIDKRDGHIYNTIKIGNQIWMAENLAYKPDNGKYWAFNNDISTVSKYGYLYTWETAKNACPAGWHLPDKHEFITLLKELGGDEFSNYKAIIPEGNSGLYVVDCGVKYGMNFIDGSRATVFWSNTEENKRHVWGLSIDKLKHSVKLYSTFKKGSGLPVRCIKD